MIKSWLDAFITILYPRICPGCSNTLMQNERIVCANCKSELPLTRIGDSKDNAVEKIFWGRINIEHASSMYNFVKNGRIQHIIHAVKYKGNEELGLELGRWMGHYYGNTSFIDVDLITPVPLHPKKEFQRGYNQSQLLAQGIGEIWKKPVYSNLLKRTSYSESQTKKGRYNRWENVTNLFEVNSTYDIENKHILLIDDVLTTGATLEACAQVFLENKTVKLSILTLAKA